MKLLIMKKIEQTQILGVKIDSLDYPSALLVIKDSIAKKKKGYICVSAVHLIMECQDKPHILSGVNKSLLTTPDGMPLVWLSKFAGKKQTQRVYGPSLMIKACEMAAENNYSIFLLGGRKGQSAQLKKKLIKKFPQLKIVGNIDTPTRPLPKKVNHEVIKQINKTKAKIVFVGLGCPIQEEWMIENIKTIDNSILIGVGAAFDFITNQVRQAPHWMQSLGLEWFFRLLQEPQRLWKRYTVQNIRFIFLVMKEFLPSRRLTKTK